MTRALALPALFLAAAAFAAPKPHPFTVTVANPLDEPRANEIVEVAAPQGDLLVHDARGHLLPCQRTHEGTLLFPATVPARGTATYILTPALAPYTHATLACGRVYPERVDDVAWENDLVAFRAYGPALQKSGERAYGYDVWCKRATTAPVVEKRYFDELRRGITYHRDHGNGLDCYKVGPTLGAGTTALLQEGALLYPWAYQTCQILDNGPLRFTVRLTYPKNALGAVEERTITLDAHTHFNKTTVTYKGLPADTPLAVGIVHHKGSKENLVRADLILCDDPGDLPKHPKEVGTLYIGALFPTPVKEAKPLAFDEKTQKRTAAEGHLLGITTARDGAPFTYYWGAGWSRGDIPDWAAWKACAETTLRRLHAPLVVTLAK